MRRQEREEKTPEITGADATMDEATVGDAWNGANPYDADMTGGPPKSIEDEPDDPEDIAPDHIERFASAAEEEEEQEPELTARPHEQQPVDPSET